VHSSCYSNLYGRLGLRIWGGQVKEVVSRKKSSNGSGFIFGKTILLFAGMEELGRKGFSKAIKRKRGIAYMQHTQFLHPTAALNIVELS
jgi:hypothetical protein